MGLIAVRPDGSQIYVGTENYLTIFDGNFRLLRRIPIPAFKLGAMKYGFGGDSQVSNDRIWLSVLEISKGYPPPMIYQKILMEWNPDESSAKRIVADVGGFDQMAVDSQKRRAYVANSSRAIYDFTTSKLSKMQWEYNFDYVDFDSQRGVLFSNTWERGRTPMARYDTLTGEVTEIGQGVEANWGPDDFIYFCVGNQLWRCKSDGTGREPVYVPDPGRPYTEYYARYKKFSPDRSLLAFCYSLDGFWKDKCGTILIDFKNREYRILDNITHDSETMAWVLRQK
jgi:hypothetical protein